MTLIRLDSVQESPGEEIFGVGLVILAHGGNAETEAMNSKFKINFRSPVVCGMEALSARGTGYNSRYDKAINAFDFFYNNPDKSFDYLSCINFTDNPERSQRKNARMCIQAISKAEMSDEEKGEFIKNFKYFFLTEDFTKIEPTNQIITVPKLDSREYFKDPNKLNREEKHDVFGGCFLVRNTKFTVGSNEILSFHPDVNLKIGIDSVFEPTDCTVLSDWVSRFHMTQDEIIILLKFICLKNSSGGRKFKLWDGKSNKFSIQKNLVSFYNSNEIFFIEDLFTNLNLEGIKIWQFDLEGMTILLFLIHKLTKRKEPTTIEDPLFEEILGILNSIEDFDNLPTPRLDDNFQLIPGQINYPVIKFKILDCIVSSNYVTSILSYACRGNDIGLSKFPKSSIKTRHRGRDAKIRSKLRKF
jgi:hypothetical protein